MKCGIDEIAASIRDMFIGSPRFLFGIITVLFSMITVCLGLAISVAEGTGEHAESFVYVVLLIFIIITLKIVEKLG